MEKTFAFFKILLAAGICLLAISIALLGVISSWGVVTEHILIGATIVLLGLMVSSGLMSTALWTLNGKQDRKPKLGRVGTIASVLLCVDLFLVNILLGMLYVIVAAVMIKREV